MYRVVLVDDETIIVEGLRWVVKWADYDCEVVGTAGDAAEGAELIHQLRPHILFTDIRMTGEDGLSMLAALRSEFPDMQVAVLTGYRDFTYAQEAIRLGVTRFLLKSSKMDEIKEALTAMTKKLEALPRDPESDPLLEDPSLKIGDISEMVGYADTAHFARTFKKLENMSANEYRNSLRR